MRRRVIIEVLMVFMLLFIAGCLSKPSKENITISSANISGTIGRNQVWSGDISVTGDIIVEKGVTLTLLPGTIVTVTAFSDDQHGGIDRPHDEPFPKDPDRKETSSTIIQIDGFLNASGTPDNKIIFTTDKKQTTYDWDGLYIVH